MEQLKNIKQCLVSAVQTQLGDLKKTDAKELGEVVDMIKDLEEAMYYCAITEAMEKTSKKEEEGQMMNVNYYMEPMYYRGQARDSMGRYTSGGRRGYDEPMYYDNGSQSSGNQSNNGQQSSGMRNYVPYMEYAPYMMRDNRWRDEHFGDKSGMSRRMYMEGKQAHGDDQQSMKELEHYIKDLGEDLTDMIKESSQEEKQILSTKLQQLAAKVNK